MDVIRNELKYKQLERMFGGTWKYTHVGHLWECDDGRMVWGVPTCCCDGPCSSIPKYYLYGSDGEQTEEVHFDGQRLSVCMTNPF